MSSYKFKVGWCPVCNQGWIQIVKDVKTHKLFLLCSECESVWHDPKDIKSAKKAKRINELNITKPTIKEIKEIGWDKYLIK